LSYDRVGGQVRFKFMSKCLLIGTILAMTSKYKKDFMSPCGQEYCGLGSRLQ
jgi:hypothetical protein